MQQIPCLACGGQQRQRLSGLLSAAEGHLSRAEDKLGFIAQIDPILAARWNKKLAELREGQTNLVGSLGYLGRDPNFGSLIVLSLIAGGAGLVTLISGLIYKQHQKTKEVEKRFDIYADMVERGVDPVEAQKLASGGYLAITGAIEKVTILVAVAGALYLASKLL